MTNGQPTLRTILDQRFGLVEPDDTWEGVRTMSKSYGMAGRNSGLRDRVVNALRTAPKGDLSTDEVVEALDYPNRGSVQATLSDCHLLEHVPVMRVGKSLYRYIHPDEDEVSHMARLEQKVSALIGVRVGPLAAGDLLEVVHITRDGVVLVVDEQRNLLRVSTQCLLNLDDPALQV